MSKIHSSTSHPHPVGFNDNTYTDPFFNSNNSEENLVPVYPTSLSTSALPTPHSHPFQAPASGQVLRSNDARRGFSAGQATYQSRSPPSNSGSTGHHTSSSPMSQAGTEGHGNDQADFLSPNTYTSDNGYVASSERTVTPEYSAFYFEENYDVLGSPDQVDTPPGAIPPALQNAYRNPAAHRLHPPRTDSTQSTRPSVGTATMSSTLMSPVLTEAPEHSTREGTSSPPDPPQPTDSKRSRGKLTSPSIKTEQFTHSAPSGQYHLSRANRGDSRARCESEEDDGGGDEERFNHRTALDPTSRQQYNGVQMPTLKEQEESAQIAMKNADVEEWLDRSASGSEASGPDTAPRKPRRMRKQKAPTSAGGQSLSHANLETLTRVPTDPHLPGPGVLINESSGEEDSDDGEMSAASIEDEPIPSPTEGMNETPGEARPGHYDELPNQHPFHRVKVWQDPLYDSSNPGIKMQPVTSNDAMARFERRAAEIDNLSRVATWGTRRLSESDLESLFQRFSMSDDRSVAEETKQKSRDRSGSFFQQAAARLNPRRANLKRKESEKSKQNESSRPPLGEHARTASVEKVEVGNDSLSVPRPAAKGLQRMSSLGKRGKSPKTNTIGMAAALPAQVAAGVGSAPLSTSHAAANNYGPWGAAKNAIKRSRSRSELNTLPSNQTGGQEFSLAELWTKQGGPPIPALGSIKTEENAQDIRDLDEDEDDDIGDDHGVTMDLSIKTDPIIPTLDGFKANAWQLNPRLPSYMVDRIAQEQLRRFKKLMDFKVKHVQAMSRGACPSRNHCTELGGEPTYFPSKATRETIEPPHAGFTITGLGGSDDDANALVDGIVTPAQFPAGVPMPPVKRLPAEFECSICFKVKKFNKPSDWSKHVHEDVQPFTCTFAQCAEPKSFKRKADWVRHENERHRQLEWWQCSWNECSHKCYRKDNFVQHLVREHKLPEPKAKTLKAGKPAVRGPSTHKARSGKLNDQGDDALDEFDQVWKLVEVCRHETSKSPKEEPCKFCGNVCNSWKKLTVHLAKHMEQISMPVLSVVKQKDVTADTIISPIEQQSRMNPAAASLSMSPVSSQPRQRSPYDNIDDQTAATTGVAVYGNGLQQQNYLMEPQYQRAAPNTFPPTTPQQQQQHQQFIAAYQQIARSQSPQAPNYAGTAYDTAAAAGAQYSASAGPSQTGYDASAATATLTATGTYSPVPSNPEDMYSSTNMMYQNGGAVTSQPRPHTSSPYQAGGDNNNNNNSYSSSLMVQHHSQQATPQLSSPPLDSNGTAAVYTKQQGQQQMGMNMNMNMNPTPSPSISISSQPQPPPQQQDMGINMNMNVNMGMDMGMQIPVPVPMGNGMGEMVYSTGPNANNIPAMSHDGDTQQQQQQRQAGQIWY